MTRLPERNLDVLRAVAVLCVLFDHIGLLVHRASVSPLLLAQVGHTGVLLFFVHTSLVLMSSLERQGSEGRWAGVFYLRRAFRIYPLAIATVCLVVLLGIPRPIPAIGVHALPTVRPLAMIVENLTLVQNLIGVDDVLGPFWTLPVEVDMYLLLPLCYLVARRTPRDMLLLLGALVAAHFVVASPSVPGAWRLGMFQYGPCFFGGVLAYHLLRTRARPLLPAWTLAPVLAAAIVFEPLVARALPDYLLGWIACVALGATLPWIAELAPSALTAAGHTVAKYSYGVYLLHIPIFWFAFDVCRALPLGAQAAIALVALIVVPWLAYHLVEQPGIRAGQRLVHRRLTLAATQPAP